MDGTWERIADVLQNRGRNWAWLADQLGSSIQQVQNWKQRGVPPKNWVAIADVLEVSLDWLAGRAVTPARTRFEVTEPPGPWWPFGSVSLARFEQLNAIDKARIEAYLQATVHAHEAMSHPAIKGGR